MFVLGLGEFTHAAIVFYLFVSRNVAYLLRLASSHKFLLPVQHQPLFPVSSEILVSAVEQTA